MGRQEPQDSHAAKEQGLDGSGAIGRARGNDPNRLNRFFSWLFYRMGF
jgi:hypothetical protein